MKYFEDYFKNCKYEDDFKWNIIWNKEIDNWLKNIYKIDKGYYNKGKKRIKRMNEREGFLAEIFTIFYFQNYLGFNNIKIEPYKNTLEDVDFCSNDTEGVKWFIEVKTASWRKQIIKNPKKPTKQELQRINEPQYKSSDGGYFSSRDNLEQTFLNSIKNSVKKFKKINNNILVVVPNLKLPVIDTRLSNKQMKHDILDIVKCEDCNNLIDKVIILEKELIEKKVSYCDFIVNISEWTNNGE